MTGSPSREAGTSGDARARRGPCLLLGVSPGGWLPDAPHQVRPPPSPSPLACVPQKLRGQREPSALSPTARGRPRVPRRARTRPRRNRTAAAAIGLAQLTRKPKRKRSPRRLREDEKRRTWRSGPGELLDPVPPPRGAPRPTPPRFQGRPALQELSPQAPRRTTSSESPVSSSGNGRDSQPLGSPGAFPERQLGAGGRARPRGASRGPCGAPRDAGRPLRRSARRAQVLEATASCQACRAGTPLV